MKKFQLKYSAPKTKVNSAGKVEQQNQKKPNRNRKKKVIN